MNGRTPEPARQIAPALCVAGVVTFAVFLLARGAGQLPFWYDESLTVRLSRLSGIGELWRALSAGIEFTPPLIYLVTKAARLLPGPETLTARLPALAGYVLLSVSLFIFMRRRLGAWFAAAAVALVPLASYTVLYAIEARAYMLLLGVSGIALVCWQTAAGRPSRFAPIGLALSVATALLLHVWAIVLPLALLAGEAIAFAQTRVVRWRIVGALAAAAPALIVYPVLLRASGTVVFGGPAYSPSLDKLETIVRNDLPRPRVVLAALAAAAIAGWWARRRHGAASPDGRGFTWPEWAVLSVLAASPVLIYVYATIASVAFMTRYGLFGLPAIVCTLGAALFSAGRGHVFAGQAASVAALVGVLVYFPSKVPKDSGQIAVLETLTSALDTLDPSLPIVLVNPVEVLAFDEQAADSLIRRAVFVADPDMALKYTQTNGIDFGYLRGEPYLNVRVRRVSYDALTRDRPRVYLAGKWQALSWLPQRLKDDGWTVTEIVKSAQAPIFEARKPVR